LFKSLFISVQFLFTLAKYHYNHPLTKIFLRDKMALHTGMAKLGSDASAAGGGYSELSAWQRSARDEGGSAEDIRRAPQQEDSVDSDTVTSVKVFREGLL